MSGRYKLSPAAQRDLADIWTYTRRMWGVEQARYYVRSIRDACEALGRSTKRGQAIEDIRPGYRRLAVGAHVLFYRHGSNEEVEVIRILHQRMDVSGNLDDG